MSAPHSTTVAEGVGTCDRCRADRHASEWIYDRGLGCCSLAAAGASAALGGLLFVAVSINLNRIIAIRSQFGAALGAIVLLVAVLMVSTFALVPGQLPLGARHRGARGGDRRLVDPDHHLD